MAQKLIISIVAVLSENAYGLGRFLAAAADDSSAEDTPTLRFATYNAGIADQHVGHASERIPVIASALPLVDADVICMQEAWTNESIEAFINGSKGVFPHSFYEFTQEDPSDWNIPCTTGMLWALDQCMGHNNCGAGNVTCGALYCSKEFTQMSPLCQACTGRFASDPTQCLRNQSSFYYNGHNGLMVLSKHPLKNPKLTLLPSFAVQRAWIEVTVGTVTVGCTHLTTPLDYIRYGGEPNSSYVGEQANQIHLILDALALVPGPVVLLGDMNTGPQVGNLTGEFTNNFALFRAAGYTSLNPERFCTWCQDNTLNDATKDCAIDHVLVRDATASDVARFLDGTVNITVDGQNDVNITTSYSDHYGLATSVSVV